MQNGFFRLVNDSTGYGIALYQPKGGGEEIQIGELFSYLDGLKIGYDFKKLEMMLLDDKDSVCHLGNGDCPVYPESYNLNIRNDGMMATVRFVPPSEGGARMDYADFLRDMKFKGIVYNIQADSLKPHFEGPGVYGTDFIVAKGDEPVQGTDARIEYNFNTDTHRRPLMNPDGSVDYFRMTTINQCKRGEVLARIIPEQMGEPGHDIYGKEIAPRPVKKSVLSFGRNIELSEDKNTIFSQVDGHVSLVDNKVFVSDVYEVKNVDVSTGNIEYEGNVLITGDVTAGFEVKSGGDVTVYGLVESARIIAGGNIVIAKGMNGTGKGYLKAGGDVIVKFLENVRVVAAGYLQTEAILNSKISVGSDVIVEGKRGLIIGGYVQATNSITAKTIGANLGTITVLEVGVNPLLKSQYTKLQTLVEETTKTVKDAEIILENFKEKMHQRVQFNESQLKYMKSVAALVEEKSQELVMLNTRLGKLHAMMEVQRQAEVVVNDQIHANTTIIIGDYSRTLHNDFHYCRFVRDAGEVKMAPM